MTLRLIALEGDENGNNFVHDIVEFDLPEDRAAARRRTMKRLGSMVDRLLDEPTISGFNLERIDQ